MNEYANPRAIIGANAPPLAEQLALSEAELMAEVEAIARRANDLPKKLTDATAEADIAAIGPVVRDAIALSKRVDERRVAVKAPWLEGERAVDGFYRLPAQRLSTVASFFQKLVGDYREEKRREDARKAAEEARQRQQEEAARRRAVEEAERKGRERTAAVERQKAEEAGQAAREAEARAAEATAIVPATVVKTDLGDGLSMKTKGEWTHKVANLAAVDLEALRPYIKGDHIEQAIKMAVRMGVRELRGVEIYQAERVRFA